MIIYLDKDFKCHISKDSENYIEYETDIFDGKCNDYIEGYRIVPRGKAWSRGDGRMFEGEMVAPWRNTSTLREIQSAYEREQLAAVSSQNEELITTIAQMVEDTYQEDLATIGEEDATNGTE